MKKTAPLAAWIEQTLAADPPRAKSLVVTIFGDSIAPHGDSIWLQSLIDLLRPFGVNERLVRSSVFRLIKEEWLVAERHGRRSRYSLTVTGRKRFEHAHDKIYFHPERHWDSEWTLVIAPSIQIPAARRVLLRRELEWEGFRLIGSGTFAHPSADRIALAEIVQRLKVPRVTVCSAKEIGLCGTATLQDLVRKHWDLKPIQQAYRRFIARLKPLMNVFLRGTTVDREQAFVIRTLLIHAFRRVLLHDPLLPAELLPEDWPGLDAYERCRSVYQHTYCEAEDYVIDILGPGAVAKPAPFFSERFGGSTPSLR
jgi:phenylacetic acid degradation operon negative regulatory protein